MGLGLGIRPTRCLFSVFLCVSGCRRKPWRVCKGTDLPSLYRRRGGYFLTIAFLRLHPFAYGSYHTPWNCQTTPGQVQTRPRLIAHAHDPTTRALQPIGTHGSSTWPGHCPDPNQLPKTRTLSPAEFLMPLTLLPGYDTLVFGPYDHTGAPPRTAVRPDDPIQNRGHDKSPPLAKDSSSNPVVLKSCLSYKQVSPT
ncbi:hypothetical protein IGI04_007006 [Brassica rapa subsp. trilocularis]|uniref:Secreted protein n=1 Tax=Brassica rapa subsp. trilocularis TaxID=1813537 RepID=A0ABQ7NIH8_BRACM|nr:hypothetical protein IGI04_007006 [Brassica rapa subsp. trilocularis]